MRIEHLLYTVYLLGALSGVTSLAWPCECLFKMSLEAKVEYLNSKARHGVECRDVLYGQHGDYRKCTRYIFKHNYTY